MTATIVKSTIDHNDDGVNLAEPMNLGDKFDGVAGGNRKETGVNGQELIKYFTHGIQLQFRAENPEDDDNKVGEMIGRTIAEIQKLNHITTDQIYFYNHENTPFTCADMPQIAKDVKLFFNWKLVKNPKVSGHTKVEVFIKIKMVFYDFWNKVKAPMLKWMKANRVFMKPCRGLTSQELVKIGVLGLGNPFMNRTVLAD